jgi:hypothetical protein
LADVDVRSVIERAFSIAIVNLEVPRVFWTLIDSTCSRFTQRSGTHQDHPIERTHSSSSDTSATPNGQGNVRQVPVEAVTRKDDGPIASILPEAESFMDVPIGPAQVRRTGHPESVL